MGSGMNAASLRRDPVRLALSKAPWSAVRYLTGYLFIGTALFAVALTAALTGAVLGITLAGVPLLVAAAAVVSWCADVERARLRRFYGTVEGDYRAPVPTPARQPCLTARQSHRHHHQTRIHQPHRALRRG
jgi:putative sensor protein